MNEFISCYCKLPPDAQNALVTALEFFASFERYFSAAPTESKTENEPRFEELFETNNDVNETVVAES